MILQLFVDANFLWVFGQLSLGSDMILKIKVVITLPFLELPSSYGLNFVFL